MKKLLLILPIALLLFSCGNKVTELPQVTTTNPLVSDTAVIVGGDVTFTGGDNNTTRGVCWSTNPNPTTNDNFMLDASNGAGLFSLNILSQLSPDKKYYYKAFAENSVGKTYGNELSLNTSYSNPNNAFINSNGCIECDNYAVGDTFMLNGQNYIVADRSMLDDAVSNEDDLTQFCVSKVTDMSYIFRNTSFNQDIRNWDVSNVRNMYKIFEEATSFNQDIGNWDVSSVTDMRYMFKSATSFNQDIGKWDVSSVTHMDYLLYEVTSFNQPIGNWDVSSVTDMRNMFYGATSFNVNIAVWDVSNVTNMVGMFGLTSSFNQDLSGWCVSQISSKPSGFSYNSALIPSNYPVWGTCP